MGTRAVNLTLEERVSVTASLSKLNSRANVCIGIHGGRVEENTVHQSTQSKVKSFRRTWRR